MLKPWLEDKGVEQDKQGNCYRVLQLSLPGQNLDTLEERPLAWECMWRNNKDSMNMAEYLLQTAKVIKPAAPLTLEWRLPWIKEQEWKTLQKEAKDSIHPEAIGYLTTEQVATIAGLADTLYLRLWHTPDMAYQYLNVDKGGIAFKISLTTWSVTRPQPAYIEPLKKGTDIPMLNQIAIFKG